MPDPPSTDIPRPALLQPQVRLWGDVNDDMLGSFHAQIGTAVGAGPLVIELTTNGGDAEMGRRLAMEIRLLHERLGRRIVFLGATAVYSAGVSIMAAFPRTDRVLTADAVLLIHRRRLSETVDLHGSLSVCEQKARELLTQIKDRTGAGAQGLRRASSRARRSG